MDYLAADGQVVWNMLAPQTFVVSVDPPGVVVSSRDGIALVAQPAS